MSQAYDLLTDTITIAPNNAGRSINAFGFRPQDGFAYGIFSNTTELAQLGSNGTVVSLGIIAGLPNANYPAGAIADDGLLYVYSSSNLNMVYVIDLTTISVVNVINVPGPTFTAPDITFNPVDNRFYAVTSGGVIAPGTLFAFDRDTGISEQIGPIGTGTSLPSMFSDESGLIYGQDRSTGILYLLNIETGQATGIGNTGIDGSAMGGVDGFFCSANAGPLSRAVPTLSQWGLIAMTGVLGIVGFMVMRRRKLTV